MSELAIREDRDVELPPLADFALAMRQLVEQKADDRIDEARLLALGHELYEKHAKHRDRERHFARLRLLTEAALGVLSFDDNSIIKSSTSRGVWRKLAAGFERGRLEEICDDADGELTANHIAWRVHVGGLYHVPGESLGQQGQSIPWFRARILAAAMGVDPTTLPNDAATVARRQEQLNRRNERERLRRLAADRIERIERRETIRRLSKSRGAGPKMEAASGYLLQLAQALHAAQAEVDPNGREYLGLAIEALYRSEEYLAAALGIHVPGLTDRPEMVRPTADVRLTQRHESAAA